MHDLIALPTPEERAELTAIRDQLSQLLRRSPGLITTADDEFTTVVKHAAEVAPSFIVSPVRDDDDDPEFNTGYKILCPYTGASITPVMVDRAENWTTIQPSWIDEDVVRDEDLEVSYDSSGNDYDDALIKTSEESDALAVTLPIGWKIKYI